MKRIIPLFFLLCFFSASASAQDIYKEVRNIMQKEEAIKNDKTKSLDVRKVATFKWDAIYYLLVKGSGDKTFTTYDLGAQTSAMIDFVNLFVKRLSTSKKKSDRDILIARYQNITIDNVLFGDTDKDVIYAYVNNNNFLTRFSLDCDWVKALKQLHDKNY